jgi:ankyrin repeat protein
VNAVDVRGNSALHGAADSGHETAAWLLVEAGAKPALRNSAGDTALDLARRRGHGGLVRLLQSR